jgi:hypothetical protein
MKIINLCIFLLVNINCQEHKQSTAASTLELSKEKKTNIQQMKYINPEEVKNWSLEQIREKYKPIEEEDFLLNDAVISEFRIGLYNFFDEKERKEPILIKEITWETDKDTNYTIWYKKDSNQWIFIDSFIWDKRLVF